MNEDKEVILAVVAFAVVITIVILTATMTPTEIFNLNDKIESVWKDQSLFK